MVCELTFMVCFHDWENLVSLFHALHIVAKFTLAELRRFGNIVKILKLGVTILDTIHQPDTNKTQS